MKVRLLIALLLLQYSNSFASFTIDDMESALGAMSVSSLPKTLEAPVLNYEDMRVFFSRAPRPQTLILKDTKNGLCISWQLEWHSTHVRPSDLSEPSSEYTPRVTMQSAQGLHMAYKYNQFVSYRVDFEHRTTKETVSPFYNVFYLTCPRTIAVSHNTISFVPRENLIVSVPKIIKSTISVPAPEVPIGMVKPFMKNKVKEGILTLPDPIHPEKSYQWKFVWHSIFNEEFFLSFPEAYFRYHVSFIEDRGLESHNTTIPFASYKLYMENRSTHEIVDPFLIFYLQKPALA